MSAEGRPVITIDYTPAHQQGAGIGRYVRGLVGGLASLPEASRVFQDVRLFVMGAGAGSSAPASVAPFLWVPSRFSPRDFARLWFRARIPLPVELFAGRSSLYHATDFVLPPTLLSTRTILTVHDLSFVRVPESASPRLRRYLEYVVPRSVRQADVVLADSSATRDDVIAFYGVDPSRVIVLLSGIDVLPVGELTTRSKYGIPDRPYLFTVGTVQPRKNYARLIQALAILRGRGYDLSLVIAGGRGWLEDPIYQTLRDEQMTDYVHFIGFADDTDLPALYHCAACVVFPSLYEGFGFPILEGMAYGTPVVTSNVSSMPEVAGDAALLVDPYDTEAIAHAIQRILDDSELSRLLVARGLERVKLFTWEKSARQLLNIYRQALAQ